MPQNASQPDLFTDYEAVNRKEQHLQSQLERETRLQQSILELQKRFGKNAVLKGMNFEEGSTAIARNKQVGGHRSGD